MYPGITNNHVRINHPKGDRPKMIGAILAALIMLIAGIALISTSQAPEGKSHNNSVGPWTTTTLDNISDVGKYTSIAFDSSNYVHIAYYNITNQDLKYATNNGGWQNTTIDSVGDVGSYCSIAIDHNDKVHISYYDAGANLNLKYANNVLGHWTIITVDSVGDVGAYSSIAIDSNNRAHISYGNLSSWDVKYATNASGAWVTSTVDGAGFMTGMYTSIAVDSLDTPHICYRDVTNQDLKYARKPASTWIIMAVDSAHNAGEYCDIAVDSNNRAHISYYYQWNNSLRYATNSSGSWVYFEDDVGGENVGTDTSIALDQWGKVHISYRDFSIATSHHYLRYITNEGGSWVKTTIDTVSDVYFTGICVDDLDQVHISYYDWTYGRLMYATAPMIIPEFGSIVVASMFAVVIGLAVMRSRKKTNWEQ